MLLALRTAPCHESKGSLSPARRHGLFLRVIAITQAPPLGPSFQSFPDGNLWELGRRKHTPFNPHTHICPQKLPSLLIHSGFQVDLVFVVLERKTTDVSFSCLNSLNSMSFQLFPFSFIKDSRTGPSQPLSPSTSSLIWPHLLDAYSPFVAFLSLSGPPYPGKTFLYPVPLQMESVQTGQSSESWPIACCWPGQNIDFTHCLLLAWARALQPSPSTPLLPGCRLRISFTSFSKLWAPSPGVLVSLW